MGMTFQPSFGLSSDAVAAAVSQYTQPAAHKSDAFGLPGVVWLSSTTWALIDQRLYLSGPVVPPYDIVVNKIGCLVYTAGTGSSVEFGVYECDDTWNGSGSSGQALLASSEDSAVDTSSVGWKTQDFDYLWRAGVRGTIAMLGQTTTSMPAVRAINGMVPSMPMFDNGSQAIGFRHYGLITGQTSLIDPLTTVAQTPTTTSGLLYFAFMQYSRA